MVNINFEAVSVISSFYPDFKVGDVLYFSVGVADIIKRVPDSREGINFKSTVIGVNDMALAYQKLPNRIEKVAPYFVPTVKKIFPSVFRTKGVGSTPMGAVI